MIKCSVKPYSGDDGFIFISYSHKDRSEVFPIIEKMSKKGYRIWYDEGIDPGSEWPEIIANKLSECSAFIAFISENSINSHNCRREINYALHKQKVFVSIHLKEVAMTAGIEMQLSANQAIHKYAFADETAFYEKLFGAKAFLPCLGTPAMLNTPENDKTISSTEPIAQKPKSPLTNKSFMIIIAILIATIAILCLVIFSIGDDSNDDKITSEPSFVDSSTESTTDDGFVDGSGEASVDASEEVSNETSDEISDETSDEPFDEYIDTYNQALTLIEEEKYKEAYTLLYSIKNYTPAKETINKFKVVALTINGQASESVYDDRGNLINSKYNTIENVYYYDNLDRCIKHIGYQYGKLQYEYIYTYDSVSGLQSKMETDLSVIEFFYDQKGRKTKEVSTQKDTGDTHTIEWVYNKYGDSIEYVSSSTDYPESDFKISSDFTYDSQGHKLTESYVTVRIHSNEIIREGHIEYTYDKKGQLLTETGTVTEYDNGIANVEASYNIRNEYKYNASGLVIEKSVREYNETFSEEEISTYTYDTNGNVLRVVRKETEQETGEAPHISESITEYSDYRYFYNG